MTSAPKPPPQARSQPPDRNQRSDLQQASTWQEISPCVDEAMATLPEESRELLRQSFSSGQESERDRD